MWCRPVASAETHRGARSAEVIWSSNSIAPSQSSRVLLFECDGYYYALATDSVVEVIEYPNCAEVNGAPVWFSGLTVYQTNPVPVIDVGRYFGHGANQRFKGEQHQLRGRCVVVKLAGSTFLLAVDKILNLCQLPEEDEAMRISSNPSEIAEHRAIQRLSHYDNKQIALINLPELLRLTKFLRECETV